MSHTYEKVSSNKAKLTFTIPAEQFDEAMQKAYLKLRGRINVPGFRKGKAPRRMIETLYGEGVFYDDAFEMLFPDAYEAAVKEFDLHPVDRPDISLDEIDQAATIITDEAHPDATVIFGAAMDPSLEDEMRITLIAAGFEKSGQRKPNPAYSAPSYSNPEPAPAQESATDQNRREFDEIFDLLNRK